ncbi:MAG: hypothetical protein ACXVIY_05655 [Mucilaginibacter sp.]
MIRTIITPENQDISIHIPENYVGKQIEVLMYDMDEVNAGETAHKKKPSEFRGKLNLTDEQYKDIQSHVKNIRDEWERNI